MKFDKEVLLEIIAIVLDGLSTGTDVSEQLRDLDLETTEAGKGGERQLTLSADYVAKHPRAGERKEDEGDAEDVVG
jgi:hypothetical protein